MLKVVFNTSEFGTDPVTATGSGTASGSDKKKLIFEKSGEGS